MSAFQPSKMPYVPLTQNMVPDPSNAAATAPQVDAPQVSTLSNGMRVVTADDKRSLSSVGIFVDAGSRSEDVNTLGSALAIERMALSSTHKYSSIALNREVAKLGTRVVATSSKELMSYSGDVVRSDVANMVEILGQCVSDLKFQPWDVDNVKTALGEQAKEAKGIVDELVMSDFAHAAAYQGTTLSLPSTPNEEMAAAVNPESLQDFFQTHYTAPNMVLSVAGAAHDEVVAAAEKYFAHIGGEKTTPAAVSYSGGDVRPFGYGSDGLSHVTLSWEGVSWSDKSLAAVSVLQMMMGGGGSFSAGGPGKGMYTRLYEQVLNRYGWVHSATCTAAVHSDTGLMSLYGICAPGYSSEMVSVMTEQANKMAGPVNEAELARAKNLLKSYVLMHMEDRFCLADDMGRSIISYGEVKSPSQLCAEIDAVTAADVQGAAKKMLASPVSVAALGETNGLPQRDAIAGQISA